ncbi:MAG TPA: hypoxanthine phosphoribosyltransferase [Porphyromonadaceae bacterium]|nr:hypoxanthine phosphoribosyltransferase [Porphyromonadaceae bacterium]
MDTEIVEANGKKFAPYISEEEILQGVERVAKEISRDFKGKNPLLVVILKGAFMFASDLMKRLDFPCEVSFVKLSSYVGDVSTGRIKEHLPLGDSVEGRNVIVIEDIVDTGATMRYFINHLKELGTQEVKLASFLIKPHRMDKGVKVDYFVREIADEFVIGYGLDFDQVGRNLRNIYQAVD